MALVTHHLLVGAVEGAGAAGGTAGVAGRLDGAVKPPATHTHAAPEAHLQENRIIHFTHS